jgi:DNA-binding NarL/FixJ family response regulator
MIYIGILEDNLELRNSITDYLTATGNYSIVFSENSYFDIKRKKLTILPQFLLLDVHLTDVSVLDVIDDIKNRYAGSQIIVMTGDKTDNLLLQAIERGASSFVYKPIVMSELIKIMEQLQVTGSILEPEMLTKLMWLINQKNKKNTVDYKTELTDREGDVLVLVEQGFTYKEISQKLSISYHTVNYHLKSIYNKFDVSSKLELITKRNTKI